MSTEPTLSFRSAGRTHAGAVRTLNEDRFLDLPAMRLWAVADGMGGHQEGDAASTLVTDVLARLGPFGSGYAFLNGVTEALGRANQALVARAAELPDGGITGATVVALLVVDRHAACVWAGDSRAYHWSGDGLKQLTHDHSLVQELVDAGALAPGEAAADRRSHVITRAVGAAKTLELDQQFTPVAAGDRFLLCSDGLTGALSDPEIAELLPGRDIASAADALLALALSRQPTDNVTLVAIEAVAA